eukprot:gnl/TRDRNA2_/TRDRNA2_191834_c0_seq1.p1 gnl/TRDRNA2_/TRDRNA2_191834_c0~~gnl/TRDRNA2_/TRDRNA2_191834_c0_seq1.p1  ORF type:complete len:343 (+),score=50.90 gnl/TRDRNA2_/TRDRNA2_191834_c0_seq1:86-1114(+)
MKVIVAVLLAFQPAQAARLQRHLRDRLAQTSSEGLSFVAVGDWGGTDDPAESGSSSVFTTPSQLQVAAGMGRVASQLGARFVLGLGDNFYESGITKESASTRLRDTFENVYTASSLQVPWYQCAGNHDWKGDMSQQIRLSTLSKRWRFPDYNYSFVQELPGGRTAKFVVFDSVIITGLENSVNVPFNLDYFKADEHVRWVKDELQRSAAHDYLFTVSHYPIISSCSHGVTPAFVQKLLPAVKDAKVTAHIAGHDHCLEHLEHEGLVHVVNGAGADPWYAFDKPNDAPKGSSRWHLSEENSGNHTGGFASFTLGERGLVRYHSEDGTVLYEAELHPRHVSAKF